MICLKKDFLGSSLIILILLSFIIIFPFQSEYQFSTLPPKSIANSQSIYDHSSMPIIDDSLLTMLENDADKSIDLIITFGGDNSHTKPKQILKQILGDDFAKLDVKYDFEIIDAVLVNAPVNIVPRLAENNLVSGIWEDKKITALKSADRIIDSQIDSYLDESTGLIGADEVWAQGFDGTGVTIAIVDTGIDSTHPDLSGKVKAAKSFVQGEDTQDYDGHGTHVAGIVAGTGTASSGNYKGIAPGASLVNSKALDKTGAGTVSDVIEAIEWASDKSDIICLSLGAPGSPNDPLAQAVNTAVENGVIVCAAVGNDGELGYLTAMTPSIASKAISVGATVGDLDVASFSSKGVAPDGRSDPDIDVEAAYQLIQANDNLVTITPNVFPSAPFAPDGIMFPGDAFAFDVEIISNEPISDVTVTFEGLAWSFVTATPSSFSSVDRYAVVTVSVIIPPVAIPFTYSGRLVVKEAGTAVASSQIDLEVRAPIARVLWDQSHDADGYFGYYYGDSPYSMFYKYYEILTKQGIDLDVTTGSLTGTSLSGYDALILPDPETMLQSSEISSIQNFVSSGGDLFVLANPPGSIVVGSTDINDVILDFSSINELTEVYGITCVPTVVEADELTLSDHTVTRNVQSVYYLGCALSVNSPAKSIGTAGSYDVLAVWESGLSKVLVFGSELDFWDLLIDIEGFSHTELAKNTVTWLTFPSQLLIVYIVLIVVPIILVSIYLYRRSKKQF